MSIVPIHTRRPDMADAPKPLFVVSHEEWRALFNEPGELTKLYFAIRLRMDHQTGFSGLRQGGSRPNSEAALVEALLVDKVQGRHTNPFSKPVSRNQLRGMVRRLVAVGLLEVRDDLGRMVFFHPLAALDSSDQNMKNQGRTNKSSHEEPKKCAQVTDISKSVDKTENGTSYHEDRMKNPPPSTDKGVSSLRSETPARRPAASAVREPYSADFEQAWLAYPKRVGENNKRKAYRAFLATIRGGHSSADLIRAAEQYARVCRENGRAGTQYVKQAATFFGPDQPWADYLDPENSANEKTPTGPATNDPGRGYPQQPKGDYEHEKYSGPGRQRGESLTAFSERRARENAARRRNDPGANG